MEIFAIYLRKYVKRLREIANALASSVCVFPDSFTLEHRFVAVLHKSFATAQNYVGVTRRFAGALWKWVAMFCIFLCQRGSEVRQLMRLRDELVSSSIQLVG